MSNVIGFLEKMGRDASMSRATGSEIESALADARIDPEVRAAIVAGDQGRLEDLLGAKANVCCMVAPSRKEDDEEEESPDRDDDEATRFQGTVRRAAG